MNSSKILKEISTCPNKPNCVSSLTESKQHFMEPWTFEGEKAAILSRIEEKALSLPDSKLLSKSEDHLHFVYKSKFFRFRDDVYFAVENQKVHFKAAARLGYRDFGVNKKRMQNLKKLIF